MALARAGMNYLERDRAAAVDAVTRLPPSAVYALGEINSNDRSITRTRAMTRESTAGIAESPSPPPSRKRSPQASFSRSGVKCRSFAPIDRRTSLTSACASTYRKPRFHDLLERRIRPRRKTCRLSQSTISRRSVFAERRDHLATIPNALATFPRLPSCKTSRYYMPSARAIATRPSRPMHKTFMHKA